MRKANRQNIPDIAERNKCREAPGSHTLSKHVPEKQPSNDNLRLGKVSLGDSSKVRDVNQHIQHRNPHNRERRRNLERPLRVLQLAHDVVGVFPALVAVHDLQEGRGIRVRAASAIAVSLFDRPEVVKVLGVRDQAVTGQRRKTREHDQEQHQDLEDPEGIGDSEAPFRKDAVQEDDEGHAHDSNGAGDPAVGHGVANG